MKRRASRSTLQTMAVLHPSFAITGVLQAVGGALLPSLAAQFHLDDNSSGLLFLCFFAGTALAPLFCGKNYARSIAAGFLLMSACCVGVAFSTRSTLVPIFFFLGISEGLPMCAVNLFVGRSFAERCAPLLTFLNFSWSIGALTAPLVAAQILRHSSYRAVYLAVACSAFAAAVACWAMLRDAPEPPRAEVATREQRVEALGVIAIFSFAAFLQVGVENTSTTWLATYVLRSSGSGVASAAAYSSLYWVGFLLARGLASWVLLRQPPVRIFRVAVLVAFAAAMLLVGGQRPAEHRFAMLLLGAAVAPIYPLVISGFFARARHTSDSKWVLVIAGFGGSMLPWLAGWISTHAGGLRAGIMVIPAALLLMSFVLPGLEARETESAGESNPA